MGKYNTVTLAGMDDPKVKLDESEKNFRNSHNEIGDMTLAMVKEHVIGDKKRHLLIIVKKDELRMRGNADLEDIIDMIEMLIDTYEQSRRAIKVSKGGGGLPPEEGSQQT